MEGCDWEWVDGWVHVWGWVVGWMDGGVCMGMGGWMDGGWMGVCMGMDRQSLPFSSLGVQMVPIAMVSRCRPWAAVLVIGGAERCLVATGG